MFLLENNGVIIRDNSNAVAVKNESNSKVVEYSKNGNIVNINIKSDSKFDLLNKNCESFTRTNIIKNTLLKTTETYIRKIFVHQKNSKKHYVVREIFIDRNRNKKVANNKSYKFSLNANECINEKLNLFLNEPSKELKLVRLE